MVSSELLGVYLNDHLAGSSTGTELAKKISEENAGTRFGSALAELATEIGQDRATLAELMERTDAPFLAAVHPDERDGLVKGVELMMQVGSWDGVKARFLGRDGFYRRIRWSFLADEADQVIYCLGWIRVTTGSERETWGY